MYINYETVSDVDAMLLTRDLIVFFRSNLFLDWQSKIGRSGSPFE